jgi:hypothetical protein
MLATAAAAHTIGRYRTWVAVMTAIIMAGGFTGSTPIHALLHPENPASYSTIDLGYGNADDSVIKEFNWLLRRNPPDIAYRIYTPGCYIYYSEFHATMAGHFLGLLAVFGVAEVLRRKRALFPWIYLAVAPVLTLLSCTWLFITIGLLSYPALAVAWLAGRHPTQWRFVFLGAGGTLACLWPTLNDMCHGSATEQFYWTNDLSRDLWTVVIQWWPVYVPWFALIFAWRRMTLTTRWLHFILIPICVCVEAFYFTDRGTTLEKTWSSAFGISTAILYPIVFTQKGWLFRGLSAVLILAGLLSLGAWTTGVWGTIDLGETTFRLEGDFFLKNDPQMCRMEEVLSRMRAQTILTGVAPRAWYNAPALAAFTENRCFLGWTNAEETCGHPDEAHARQDQENAFYRGRMTAPLTFLQDNNISAVMVWPPDKLSSPWLDQMKTQLEPDYTYFDCKGDGEDNAGLFLRRPTSGR